MSRSLPGVEEWVQQDDNTPVVDFRIPPLPVLNFTFTFVALGINEDWNQKRVLATAKQQVEVRRWTSITCFDEHCRCEHDASCKIDAEWDSVDWSEMDVVGNASLLQEWIQTSGRFYRGDYDTSLLAAGADFFRIPVSVMNLPFEVQRKRHMRHLLASLGVSNVTFPDATLARELNLTELYETGWLAPEAVPLMKAMPWIGENGLNSYVANAMGQLKTIEGHIRSNTPGFVVMEDDLMPIAKPNLIRERIREAVNELSHIESADVLYLEMCFESCSQMGSRGKLGRIAKSFRPYCTGAIYYTRKGARRVLAMCKPIFAAMDNMLPRLIERGMLEAYAMVPPAFVQDSFFGTSVARNLFQSMLFSHQHFPLAPPCYENSLQLEDVRSAAYVYGPSERDDLRYVISTKLVDRHHVEECKDQTALLIASLGRIFCKDELTAVPGLTELRVLPRDYGAAWAEAGSQMTVFGMPNLSEKRTWCFLVVSDHFFDVTSLRGGMSEVLLLVTGGDDPHSSTAGNVIFHEGGSIAEDRWLLLQEALVRFLCPLLRFSWFVWCGEEDVLDGTCLEEASKRANSSAAPLVDTSVPLGRIGAVWWEHVGDL
eukprot:1757120-Rhodomonas_salina.1